MAPSSELLARGPWEPAAVTAHWHEQLYEPPPELLADADGAIAALRERGSPAHDGTSARLVAHRASERGLALELQPVRWALRLSSIDASRSIAAMCVVRASDGSWLAGRRAAWLATWPQRWALGAGGSVELGENPADTLSRELWEEWSVRGERLSVEALTCTAQKLVLLIGMAWLPDGAEVIPDEEHDAFAWWPPDVARWPPEAEGAVRGVAELLLR